MDLAQARARLERMLQWNVAPALTTAEVDDLMLFARRPDALGYTYADVLWTPTWNLRAAAAEGWRWKAAKVAAQYDVAAGGGTSFTRSQQYKHCIEMARTFGSGIGSIQMVSGYTGRSGY